MKLRLPTTGALNDPNLRESGEFWYLKYFMRSIKPISMSEDAGRDALRLLLEHTQKKQMIDKLLMKRANHAK